MKYYVSMMKFYISRHNKTSGQVFIKFLRITMVLRFDLRVKTYSWLKVVLKSWLSSIRVLL